MNSNNSRHFFGPPPPKPTRRSSSMYEFGSESANKRLKDLEKGNDANELNLVPCPVTRSVTRPGREIDTEFDKPVTMALSIHIVNNLIWYFYAKQSIPLLFTEGVVVKSFVFLLLASLITYGVVFCVTAIVYALIALVTTIIQEWA